MIKHIVLWKFGPDTKREQQEFFAASALCKSIRLARSAIDIEC